jgi:hypothetical protein
MSFSVIKIAKMGILIALAIGLNFALKVLSLEIPNVELISFVVFSSGYLLGIVEGGIVGFLTMFIYSVFSPFGMPTLPILVAQIISMTLIGVTGGVVAKPSWLAEAKIVNYLMIGVIGLVLTLVYDLLTNLAVAYMVGQLIPVLIGGAIFSLIHISSNTVIFTVLAPVMYRVKRFEVKSAYSEV